ncbi:MAG: DUF4338 domain-containing protein [Verrucomicrobia bacterium]|nr:DUF4338 domain-containing protein [Verrucomicrobiota bacterium]
MPALPRLSASTEINLQLIHGQEDPDHLLWNRLIIREHPLKAAPICGAQLRYLIRCPEGVIGSLGKEHPDLPASTFYSQEELAVLEDYKKKIPRHAQSQEAGPAANEPPVKEQEKRAEHPGEAPSKPNALTLLQANLIVAMLAGFWARKRDGHPGAKVLAEGLMILAALVADRKITGNSPARPPPPRKRSRAPG